MRKRKRVLGRPSAALVVALVALFVALGGTSYAAFKLPRNSVGTAQLKKGAVTKTKIAKKTLAGLHGARGAAGPQGPAGPQGSVGPQGLQGRPGNGSDGQFSSDGTKPAVWGTIAPGGSIPSGIAALVGDAPGSGNQSPGVIGDSAEGVGVYGEGGYAGMSGAGDPYGVEGSGPLAGLLSDTDLAVHDQIYVQHNKGVAGTCDVPASQTNATCSFQPAFEATTTPIVVLTPTADPGGSYWVSATTTTGFTLNVAVAPGSNLTFDYLVIGIANCVFPGSSGC